MLTVRIAHIFIWGLSEFAPHRNVLLWHQLSDFDLQGLVVSVWAHRPLTDILTAPHAGWSQELATITQRLVALSLSLTGHSNSVLSRCLGRFASYIAPPRQNISESVFWGFADAADQKETLSALNFLHNVCTSFAKETGLLFFPHCVQKLLLESVKLKLPLSFKNVIKAFLS